MNDSGFSESHDYNDQEIDHGYDIAVIGLAGRFPGAETIEEFWQNLIQGAESIQFFTREEMEAAGVDSKLLEHPQYVNAGGHLDGADRFDSSFFGFYPREADILDPQHRIFLEVAWEAIERAGYNPDIYKEPIGVFAGMSMGSYLYFNLMHNRLIRKTVQPYQLPMSSDKDFLTTRVSYKLNLKGPSVDVQTACSTSLVAVHLACQSLLNYECDMALAGGVSIRIPQKSGYLYQEGGILSPDGHCRPFSADARGTVSGEGAGVVVLKRLEDALRDGDTIYAVIKGTAINNDGAGKVGYTAPSVDGQAKVIASAQVLAGVAPFEISYIEAHGTGTMLGDPIEIEALSQVFREHTDEKQFCAIGSVKANIGHLDAAAGVAGLIKTVLALQHRQLPPSINFTAPNPQIDFAGSPFYVQEKLTDWTTDRLPRRAGVSSFGMGGTNAHAILEEAPQRPASGPSRAWQLITLSARTPAALEQITDNFAIYLQQHPQVNLADAAYTLKLGRKTFKYRRMLVAQTSAEVIAAIENRDGERISDAVEEFEGRPVAFMFSGQGAQYVNMARDLYQTEPIFAEQVDRCAHLLLPHLQLDIRSLIFPPAEKEDEASEKLRQTQYTQPALFIIEYGLAQLWMHWGVQPAAMIGHSIGEYVAATLAGVFSLEDALALVSARGKLMQALPGGAMLSVQLSEAEIRPWLETDSRLALAAINTPGLVAVSGPFDAIDTLEQALEQAGHGVRRLHTSHAFHSAMMQPILEPFAQLVAQAAPKPPTTRFISNVTGDWITAEQATDPTYWARHLRQTVRFADGVGQLLADSVMALLEIGPGNTLTRLAGWHPAAGKTRIILASLRHPRTQQQDQAFLLRTLGQMWLAGISLDWQAFYENERRYRIPLPTYPFQRQRHWIKPDMRELENVGGEMELMLSKRQPPETWLYAPSWRRAPLPGNLPRGDHISAPWLIFRDELGDPMLMTLLQAGYPVLQVMPGSEFAIFDESRFTIRPGVQADIDALIRHLDERNQLPKTIVIAWNRADADFNEARQRGVTTLTSLARALYQRGITQQLQLVFIGHHALDFSSLSQIHPFQAMALGPCRVVAEEFSNIRCRFLDVTIPDGSEARLKLARKIALDILNSHDPVVVYRGGRRWVQTFEPLSPQESAEARLRSRGVYLITGGLGNMGLLFARYLAQKVQARLILVGRTPLPPRQDWESWLDRSQPDDVLAQRIRTVRELESLGAEVLTFAADVADESAMRHVLDAALAHFGVLHGVLHAAGVVGLDALTPLAETAEEVCARHIRAKVLGSLNLAHLLEDQHLDFVLLQSSLSTVLGGYGMTAYAATNAFMDSLAAREFYRTGTPWMSIDWDGWAFDDGGMNNVSLGASELAILPDEGLEVLEHLLAYDDLPQVVVSTADLQARLQKLESMKTGPEESLDEDEDGGEDSPSEMHPRPDLDTPFVEPTTKLEKEIASLWEQTLGIAPVGLHDDFFALGGHSLLATQIVSRLRDAYKVNLPLRRLFEAPTIAGLARLIQAESEQVEGKPAFSSTIQPVPRQKYMPLSPGQQRLWFLDRLDPGAPLYNNFSAIKLQGEISTPLLEQSLNLIVQRHEILRTTFHEVGGKPVQHIHDEMPIHLPMRDLSEMSSATREEWILQLAANHARQPFDLSQGPLLRAEALRLAADEHIIFFTMHHIVSDGWSVAVMLEELTAIYRALAAGVDPDLPPLPIQYVDFAAWQLTRVRSDFIAEQIAWWQEQLAHLEPLELPTDRPRPPVQTSHGAVEWFQLPDETYRQLSHLAQQQGVTTFMILSAGLAALLHRYTMQDDITLGTPIANRTRVETEGLIGFLLNTLVLRTDLAGDPSFGELLARVKQTTIDAYEHQDVPFEMLVDALQPARDMSRTPLFQVMIDFQQAQLSRFQWPGLTLSLLRYDDATAKFDMTFSLEESPQGIAGSLNYNTDLFDRRTARQMVKHYIRLLKTVVNSPDLRISQLPLLDEDELARLDAWGGLDASAHDAAAPDLLQQFAAQVAARPHAQAVVQEDVALTYAQLEARANQIAHALLSRGVKPEQVVGLFLERTPELIAAIMGVLKAGAAFVVLSADYPAERTRFILQDAQVKVALGEQPAFAVPEPQPPATLPQYITPDDTLDQPSTPPALTPFPKSAAYIIYTSGTTGQPKGVVVERDALSRHIASIARAFGVTSGDRVLQFAALTFDQGLEQVFVTLTTGATLVMRGDEVWPPEDFARVVQQNQLSVINLPPAYLSQVMRVWGEENPRDLVGDLHLIISGGDALPREIVKIWRRVLPEVRLINAYGPTEAVITATTHDIPTHADEDEALFGALPIGRPVSPRTAVILDDYGNRTPIGVPGELCLGGAALARGYLHRPAITAQAFQPDVWSSKAGARRYRTGDLARFRADGVIEFLGRIDRQIKMRGFRIEPGEIEAALHQHPAIDVAVVQLVSREPDDKIMAAYIHRASGDLPSVAQLHEYLKTRLPHYMIPGVFVPLTELPLTRSGKIDYRALPPVDEGHRLHHGQEYVAPSTPVEEDLARIWAEVLGLEQVGVHDNFFELGGHSLLATQIASRMRELYDVEIPLRSLFASPTIAQLAAIITEAMLEQATDEDMADLWEQLDDLSEEELMRLLQEDD